MKDSSVRGKNRDLFRDSEWLKGALKRQITTNERVSMFLHCKELRTFSSCLLYTSPSPRDRQKSRMPSSA